MIITPEKDLREQLLKVTKPGRYTGGEYGSFRNKNSNYNIALCFPDLYEIGMSNQAIKILYQIINSQTTASCERVFAPAPDFEKILREESIDLYTLESGKRVKDHDILAFTIGYELSATNILNILELSKIPLFTKDRKNDDPIIIAGGPAVTNPLPFGSFIDLVFIGEAEEILQDLINELIKMKELGYNRAEQVKKLQESPYIWYYGRKTKVKRAVWSNFGNTPKIDSPMIKQIIPSINVVQDHGVVEIMRGCPNGCRFCHAGIFYRPYREKPIKQIIKEVDNLIYNCGYREITLSSLSSGDFSYIKELIKLLNERYSKEKISFSFPSIRVNSMTLPLISEISKVRKSGLTFAVETPGIEKQRGLNKEAPLEKIVDVLNEAKKMGWNKAKFYFMLGLPFYKEQDETDLIIDFLREVGRETRMFLNINIGTFIPKPHTPFQWSFQLNEEEAFIKIQKIKKALPSRFFKVGYQSPFMSFLEGIISRGDERAGDLIVSAFKKGARLDAWEEYINKDIWREVINNAEWNVEQEINSLKSLDKKLPWNNISMNVGEKYLKNEWEKSFTSLLTDSCNSNCKDKCGACNDNDKIRINENLENILKIKEVEKTNNLEQEFSEFSNKKIIFLFEKKGKAEYLSHINIMTIFERAFLRAGLKVEYSSGFNPKPKLEFASPLSLGFSSIHEIAAVESYFDENLSKIEIEKTFIQKMSSCLPEGLIIKKAKVVDRLISAETGKKIKSLMASFYGSLFSLKADKTQDFEGLFDFIKKNEKSITVVEKNISENTIIVKIIKQNGKLINLYKFIKDEIGFSNPFENFKICRLYTYAEDQQSYFDFYK